MADAQLPREAENGEAALAAPAPLDTSISLAADTDAPERNGDPAADSIIILPPPLPTDETAACEAISDAPALDLSAQHAPLAPAPEQENDEAASAGEDALLPVAHQHANGSPATGLLEMSPIFGAIEAAERVTAAQQPLPTPQFDAFEVGLVVLRPPTLPNGYDAEITAPPSDTDTAVELQPWAPEHLPSDLVFLPVTEPDPPSMQGPPPLLEDVPPDTAAKIAEEANATAVALEALKQLLAEKLPELEAAAARHAAQSSFRDVHSVADPLQRLHTPVSPPPMVPAHVAAAALPYAGSEPAPRGRGAMVGSFLAGFSLSWVVGAVLYMFLTAG
jgi:hypothetical protein